VRYLAILLSAIVLGCADGTGPIVSVCPAPTPTGDQCGTWAADSMVPGASLILNIRVHETDLTGTGTYSIEAGRRGDLTLAGTFVAPAVNFELHYDFGMNLTYAGTVSGGQIVGEMSDSMGRSWQMVFSPVVTK
jgi:hypothetical protein